jgi:hypothetical protein
MTVANTNANDHQAMWCAFSTALAANPINTNAVPVRVLAGSLLGVAAAAFMVTIRW